MRNDVPPWERREREPVTTYRIDWRGGMTTESWQVAAAWSNVGVEVTAVTEGRR